MSEIHFNQSLCKGRVTYERLAKLQNDIINSDDRTIQLNIMSSGRNGQTFMFIIGTLSYLADANGKSLKGRVKNNIYKKLIELEIVSHMDKNQNKRFRVLNSAEESRDIITTIIQEMPVKMSTTVSEDIISRIGELYINAFEHSLASYILGGRYFKQGKKYCFTCYDTGIGICNKVREHFRQDISDKQALEWAMQRGTSTVKSNMPRGLGLALLKEFAKLNKGTIRICTGKVLYTYSDTVEKYEPLKYSFQGTLFEMDINADDSVYRYRGEENDR